VAAALNVKGSSAVAGLPLAGIAVGCVFASAGVGFIALLMGD
jgi:hypothetical protein